ncbi:MAG TPA: magnesium/cobalt transporter CorA [Bacillales bacterium]|nr:magnesium/cobalt transporter CorA [Bacillales bacterium]
MIRTLAVTKEDQLIHQVPLERLNDPDIAWYWVDFNEPSEEETRLLSRFFRFHPLAVEDCMHIVQRPKVDFYDGYAFIILHGLDPKDLSPMEVDLFVGDRFIVSFHFEAQKDLHEVRQDILNKKEWSGFGPYHVTHLIMDHLVDGYFAPVYQIEDELNEIESRTKTEPMKVLMEQLFATRSDLLRLRHTIVPMRDLLYRMLGSQKLPAIQERRAYFTDIYDHLLKQAEMIEANREMTADIRDSYLSLNANRMNTVMMTLTVITTIFMPLTFIAGIYGMNFQYMPELTWHYGYFFILGVMAVVGVTMYFWFKRKGWFDR